MANNEELINAMMKYRAKHNLTQTEFSKKVGVTQTTLSLIESGKTNPTRFTRAKILLCIEGDE